MWEKCLFIHYEIENQRLEEGIDKQPFEPIVDNQKEEIGKLFEDKDADFIAFGHNHQLHLYDDNNKTYFNPGSVGLNNGKYAVYGIVTINENEFSVERVKLPYDNEEFLQGFDENMYQANNLFSIIYIVKSRAETNMNSVRLFTYIVNCGHCLCSLNDECALYVIRA